MAHRSKSGASPAAVRAVRIGLSLFFSYRDNKSQQKSTLHGRGILAQATNINRNQQKSTESAKVSKSEQKSAKVSKIGAGPRAQTAKISNSQQKSARFALVCKQRAVLLRANSGYWNIKECVTEDRRSSYKFLLQTDLQCGIYLYHGDTFLPPA